MIGYGLAWVGAAAIGLTVVLACGVALNLLEVVALAPLVGAGVLTFGVCLAAINGAPLSAATVGFVSASLFVTLGPVAVWQWRRSERGLVTPIDRPTRTAWLSIAAIGLLALYAFASAWYWPPADGDSLTVWVLKGRNLRDGGTIAASATNAAGLFYPLNLPLQVAAVWPALGPDHIQLLFPPYFVGVLLIIAGFLARQLNRGSAPDPGSVACGGLYAPRRSLPPHRAKNARRGPRLAGALCASPLCGKEYKIFVWTRITAEDIPWLFTMLVASTPVVLGQASTAMADVPFAFYYVASVFLLMRFVETGATGCAMLAGVLTGLLAWTRADGLQYMAINLTAIVVFGWRRQSLRKAAVGTAIVLSGFLAVWWPWSQYVAAQGWGGHFEASGGAAFRALAAGEIRWDVIGTVASYFQKRWVMLTLWGSLWLAFFAALFKTTAWRKEAPLLLIIALNVGGLLFTYYAYAYYRLDVLQWAMDSGFDRMATHFAPLLWCYTALAMAGRAGEAGGAGEAGR